eukprot:TRINITY_DN995_c0_g1_i1.p1 TRINITY_DN995_c0_g1~~TRINITY_DN995_c0_g1_i1.p1  ORF type:complete len:507 (+),score=134.52 TRINITY_DN995_c0_g1_i1:47-1522(+)
MAAASSVTLAHAHLACSTTALHASLGGNGDQARPVAVFWDAGCSSIQRRCKQAKCLNAGNASASDDVGSHPIFGGSHGNATALSSPGRSPAVAALGTETVTASPAVDVDSLAAELASASPFSVIDKALEVFGSDIAIAFSGAEDVALIELAHLTGRPYRVFSLDTGRLNPETYQLFDKVEKHYRIHIEYTFPDAEAVQRLVREKGMFSFYVDGHQECCGVRKVEPLKRMLKGLRAWITGQRKDQSPGTRAQVPIVEVDRAFEGVGGKGALTKFNPLASTSGADVWDLLRTNEVPFNPLHAMGFVSIGCEPCTRAVLPNQHEREGRWWWEDATAKECGLHKQNLGDDGAGSGGAENGNGSSSSSSEGLKDLFLDPSITALTLDSVKQVAHPEGGKGREEPWLVVLYAPWCPFCQAMEAALDALARSLASSSPVRVGKLRADLPDVRPFAEASLQLVTFPTILFFPKNSTSVIKRKSERRDEASLLRWIKNFE